MVSFTPGWNFSPANRAEISDRLLKQILLRPGWNWPCNRNNISARWAERNFSPGWNSPCNQALSCKKASANVITRADPSLRFAHRPMALVIVYSQACSAFWERDHRLGVGRLVWMTINLQRMVNRLLDYKSQLHHLWWSICNIKLQHCKHAINTCSHTYPGLHSSYNRIWDCHLESKKKLKYQRQRNLHQVQFVESGNDEVPFRRSFVGLHQLAFFSKGKCNNRTASKINIFSTLFHDFHYFFWHNIYIYIYIYFSLYL